jgi:hypothetical protein
MKPVNYIITFGVMVIVILLLSVVLVRSCKPVQAPVMSNDTTINNYYDTTIYQVVNKTVIKPTETYGLPDSLAAPRPPNGGDPTASLCDSIRKYKLTGGNDTVDIFSEITVQGVLFRNDLNYKWKLPVKTVVSIEVPVKVMVKQKGAFVKIQTANVPQLNQWSLGTEIGYLNRDGWMFSIGYNTQNQYNIGVGKLINFK